MKGTNGEVLKGETIVLIGRTSEIEGFEQTNNIELRWPVFKLRRWFWIWAPLLDFRAIFELKPNFGRYFRSCKQFSNWSLGPFSDFNASFFFWLFLKKKGFSLPNSHFSSPFLCQSFKLTIFNINTQFKGDKKKKRFSK